VIIVTDTGPLWSFAVVGRLDLLGRRLKGRVEWCSAVADEVRRNIGVEPALAEVFTQDWLPVPIDLFDLGSSYVAEAFRIRHSMAGPEDHPKAHLGEAESIVLARSLKGSVLLTEDLALIHRKTFGDRLWGTESAQMNRSYRRGV